MTDVIQLKVEKKDGSLRAFLQHGGVESVTTHPKSTQ